jgi:hypothetical protein
MLPLLNRDTWLGMFHVKQKKSDNVNFCLRDEKSEVVFEK